MAIRLTFLHSKDEIKVQERDMSVTISHKTILAYKTTLIKAIQSVYTLTVWL